MRLRPIFVIVACAFLWTSAPAQTIIVIVNPENPITDISAEDLRKTFTSDKTVWQDGTSIQVVDWKGEYAVGDRFHSTIVKKSRTLLRRTWVEKVILGNMYPPVVMSTDEQIVNYVSVHRGAIAYVEAKAVSKTVKVLTIDGVSSNDSHYILK